MKAGRVFEGPNGQGYRLVKDIHLPHPMTVAHLEPIGETPAIVEGELLPKWLVDALQVKADE